jgi:WhiB family transcriptional regulator, redox-sensing transcriptional regulator
VSVIPLFVPGEVPPRDWQDPTAADLAAIENDWRDQARCAEVDGELFFPEKGGSTREARKICAGCEVRAECRDYALESREPWGLWGGLSERERRHLLKDQGRKAA